ncbi:MAG: hypothetical protein CMF22_11880 [Idiomarinaceae bacterium]|nr:hypothetical protein [Idiomarinaceae bacterium]|tara:strand:+ start:29534 stop:30214 length:681 start_codon:yes stop_codon:yes gene_type:complete
MTHPYVIQMKREVRERLPNCIFGAIGISAAVSILGLGGWGYIVLPPLFPLGVCIASLIHAHLSRLRTRELLNSSFNDIPNLTGDLSMLHPRELQPCGALLEWSSDGVLQSVSDFGGYMTRGVDFTCDTMHDMHHADTVRISCTNTERSDVVWQEQTGSRRWLAFLNNLFISRTSDTVKSLRIYPPASGGICPRVEVEILAMELDAFGRRVTEEYPHMREVAALQEL